MKPKAIIPISNTPQETFLKCPVREVLFGGAAGGMKSFSLLMDATAQLHLEGYHAILFRRTFSQLSGSDGLIPLSHKIYPLIGGHYSKVEHLWTFDRLPGTIKFGHLQYEKTEEDYSGHSYAFIAFDELQSFSERQYLFLFSRNRSSNPKVKLYMRATANPGGIGHYWIKRRFIDTRIKHNIKWFKRIGGIDTETSPNDPFASSRLFIPSRLEDNPFYWQDGRGEYVKSLHQLNELDFIQQRWGDWEARREGLVYYNYNPDKHLIPYDAIPPLDEFVGFYTGHDFGSVNKVWILVGKHRDGVFYVLYEEPLPEMTTADRTTRIKEKTQGLKVVGSWGGAPGEDQPRWDMSGEGFTVSRPKLADVETQIDATNELFADDLLYVSTDCTGLQMNLENCVRDDIGRIAQKSTWHYVDCLRYFAIGVRRPKRVLGGYGFIGANDAITNVPTNGQLRVRDKKEIEVLLGMIK